MLNRYSVQTLIARFVATVLAAMSVQAQTTWYVDDDAPGDPAPGDPTISDPAEDGSAGHPFDAIQEGIDAAVDGDTVLVVDGTYTGDGNKNLDFGGRLITVRSENGSAVCIINCEDEGRGLYFHSGETEAAVIDGLTIMNGDVGTSDGGAVYSTNETGPTLRNCTIVRNRARSGGGIYCAAATVSSCTISENQSVGVGAGIRCESAAIEHCTISRNSASTSFGGGVHCSGDTRISDCTITDNQSEDNGGGIYGNGVTLTVANCQISGNVSDSLGGGIAATMTDALAIDGCTIDDNWARQGGGIHCEAATISRCTISGNYGGGGGGIKCESTTIEDCTISGNVSSFGGGIQCGGTTEITDCKITANCSNNRGGGVYCSGGALSIRTCRFSRNVTEGPGGGIDAASATALTVHNCTLVHNDAGGSGGAIRTNGPGGTILTNCTFAKNGAVEYGGAIVCPADTDAIAWNCIFWGNRADAGAQIAMSVDSSLSISFCVVEGGQSDIRVYSTTVVEWGSGNLETDPLLTRDGMHLRVGSVCLDAGDPDGDYTGQVDINGDPRLVDGRVDIGADEFLDSDGDHLPDWWESLHYGSATGADPLGNDDGDARSNLEEYLASANPLVAPQTYFVDVDGDDDWDGRATAWDGTHGPKATIAAGIDIADQFEGDELIVNPGTYVGEGNCELDFGAKVLTVRSTDPTDPATVAATVIDCGTDSGAAGYAVLFHLVEGPESVLSGLTLCNGTDYTHGLVSCQFSSPTIENCTITGHTRSGFTCSLLSRPTIRGCTITGNTALFGGGIRCVTGSHPLIVDCAITDNTAERGGGIYCLGANITVTGSTVSRNSIYRYDGDAQGGGIYIRNASEALVRECEITHNATDSSYAAGNYGAGIYCGSSVAAIEDCHISNNTADHSGAGIGVEASDVIITRCDISNNNAAWRGGGVAAEGGSVSIDRCWIDGNAAYYGGGVSGSDGATVHVAGSVIHGNTATAGAGLYPYRSPTVIDNSIITGNTATSGGGFYCSWSTQHAITNSILWNNAPEGSEIMVYTRARLAVSYSDVQGGEAAATVGDDCTLDWLDGNLDEDPLFVDPNNGDYRSSAGSPVINAGSNYIPGLPMEDFDGNPRVQHCRVDMGAYESPEPPAVFDDCNANGVEDDCDVYDGTSDDCNENHVPDDCIELEDDCNDNGVPDECDIADGTSEDCNSNGIPDDCIELESDCNENGVPDECDLADGTSADCNLNDTPDECDIADGTSADCNHNGIPDECIELENDCNENGVPDECDVDPTDPDGDGEVSGDCNENGIPDECDIADGTSEDCNDNGIPDECLELEDDCNENGIPDECDLADGTSLDCNHNVIPDECDIADGTSNDCNDDGTPDECQALSTYTAASGQLSPIGADSPQSFTVASPPVAISDVTLTLQAVADLAPWGNKIDVYMSDVWVARAFGGIAGHDCPDTPDSADRIVPALLYNSMVDAGDVVITLIPTDGVDADHCDPPSYVIVSVAYEYFDGDCNANDVLDECDIADGTSHDIDGNGIPDECDCPGDLDHDRDVDLSDLAQLLPNYGCASGASHRDGDLDFDGDVDLSDLSALLSDYRTSCD